ncbi:DUF2334 domain-containing protein [Streptomyces abikoensis]|uniref:DUF2334 domain-containing protein n=1 Tax=Streptomyces abikoensis TaxID=97398 RepID=UPI001677598D|nr:polysaccharide deacetylase family protein [Streptomyces abikoensis]GGP46122.1 DUF2334 domain-containing protein [Streptomyces abikoensis]
MTAVFVVSVHDVAPWSFSRSRRWLAELDARGVPATLLLVPGAWRGPRLPDDPALVRWLHEAARRGHELSLHGCTHRAVPGGPPARRWLNSLLARGCAEFCALDEVEAHRRLSAGLAALASVGIAPEGFTPPGWLASPGSFAALRAVGLEYTTSHLAVHDLRTGARHRMPALSHRPGGLGERAGARLMRAAAGRWSGRGRPFRIALHPADLDRPGLRELALEAVDLALAAGARPWTYAGLVRALRRPGDDDA